MCLCPGEVVQFAQPVEYATSAEPFSNGQMLGLVIHGLCQAFGPPLTCNPQLLSSGFVLTCAQGPRGVGAEWNPVQCGLSQLPPCPCWVSVCSLPGGWHQPVWLQVVPFVQVAIGVFVPLPQPMWPSTHDAAPTRWTLGLWANAPSTGAVATGV